MQSLTDTQRTLGPILWKGFLYSIKIGVICLFLWGTVLVVGQSVVAPVSSRLIGIYAVEYFTATLKPYRAFFPKPYMVDLEEDKR